MALDLITLMGEEQVSTSNFLPTKKELKANSEKFAKDIIDSGDYNITEVYAQAVRLKEAITTIESILKNQLGEQDFEAFGLTGKFRNGGSTPNYKEDEIYNVLKSDLDARVELLKLAQKQEAFDGSGNEVPKVSINYRKSSMAISF